MIAAPPEKKVTDDEIHSIDNPVADAGYTVARLRSSIYYINENMPIQKLVDLFNDRASEVNAVGVVTGGGGVQGHYHPEGTYEACEPAFRSGCP